MCELTQGCMFFVFMGVLKGIGPNLITPQTGKPTMTAKPDLSVHLSPPPPPSLPQFQRPHRLRCFTQPMKCLKDTESVSGHGFLSAGLPEGSQLSHLCAMHALIFLSMDAHTEYGSLVAPMYNPLRGGPALIHK